MDIITKSQHTNRNFKRLYWNSNKKQILEILSHVNIKYLKGVLKHWHHVPKGANGARFYIRYDGYQFQVSYNTTTKELNRRYYE